jgi:hypothetical protein
MRVLQREQMLAVDYEYHLSVRLVIGFTERDLRPPWNKTSKKSWLAP